MGNISIDSIQKSVSVQDCGAYYITALGWKLVSIPPGAKGPTVNGWNLPEKLIDTVEKLNATDPKNGIGAQLEASGIVSLDIDSVECIKILFSEFGLDYDELLAGAPRIVGSPGHDKALFRAPEDMKLSTHKLTWPSKIAGEKNITVVEFRGGAVQDVLPPTMHPGTGVPYAWAVPPGERLLDLPKPLLAIWQEWEKFKPQLENACPWDTTEHTARPPIKPRIGGKREEGVIDQFNARYSTASILSRNGYTQKGRNRWISPHSSTGLPGVVIFSDGRAFSHHASDTWSDGHSHDAFGLFTELEHGGNLKDALSRARDMVSATSISELEAHGAQVDALLMGAPVQDEPAPEETPDEIPPDLLTVPGVLGDVVDVYNRSAIKAQPQFAVTTALALGSVVMGRRWITSQKNYSALYFLNIAKSSGGKEHIRSVIRELLAAASLTELYGPTGYTSKAGLLSALMAKPAHITIIDEFGKFLEATRKSNNSNGTTIYDGLLQVFGLAGGEMKSDSYSMVGWSEKQKKEHEERRVVHPSLTLVGMTTPNTLYENITGKDIVSGFLPRMVIVVSDRRDARMRRDPEDIIPSPRLVQWMRACAEAFDPCGNLADTDSAQNVPAPVRVPFSDGAYKLILSFEDYINEHFETLERKNLGELVGKQLEIACRIALIVARSNEHDAILEEDMKWAIKFTDFYMLQAIALVKRHISGSDFETVVKDVAAYVEKHGKVTSTAMITACRRYKALDKRTRDEVIKVLEDDYNIIVTSTVVDGKKGRPVKWFEKIRD